MSRHVDSLPVSYFDNLYASDPDPWRFATSEYEREKYDTTLKTLPRMRYSSVLEVGCSIGVLTSQLVARCDQLLAVDIADAALVQAQLRCARFSQVRFEKFYVPMDWPSGSYDLILLSEILYYLDRSDLARLALRVAASMRAGGDVVLVHWLGETDYPLTGDEAADAFISMSIGFAVQRSQARTRTYRLDVLRVTGTPAI